MGPGSGFGVTVGVGGGAAEGVGVKPNTVEPPPRVKMAVGSPPSYSPQAVTMNTAAAVAARIGRSFFRSKDGSFRSC